MPAPHRCLCRESPLRRQPHLLTCAARRRHPAPPPRAHRVSSTNQTGVQMGQWPWGGGGAVVWAQRSRHGLSGGAAHKSGPRRDERERPRRARVGRDERERAETSESGRLGHDGLGQFGQHSGSALAHLGLDPRPGWTCEVRASRRCGATKYLRDTNTVGLRGGQPSEGSAEEQNEWCCTAHPAVM